MFTTSTHAFNRSFILVIAALGLALAVSAQAGDEQLVADMAPGPASSAPRHFTPGGDRLYFEYDHPADGRQWIGVIDDDGAHEVLAPERDRVHAIQSVGTTGYYASDGGGPVGRYSRLWQVSFDGSDHVARLVAEFGDGQQPTDMAASGGWLWYGRGSAFVHLLYRTNGGSPVQVRSSSGDLRPEGASERIDLDGTLFFSARNIARNRGRQLWWASVDGTLHQEIMNPFGNANPQKFTTSDTHVFFQATDGQTGSELWASDGSSVWQVVDAMPGAADGCCDSIEGADTKAYFVGSNAAGRDTLWVTDGAGPGATELVSVWQSGPVAVRRFGNLRAVGDRLYFTAQPNPGSRFAYALYVTDGTAASTRLVKTFDGATPQPYHLTEKEGLLYFLLNEPSGRRVWVSDGTTDGTVPVTDPSLAVGGNSLQGPGVVGSTLYFAANDGTAGEEPWKLGGNAPPIAACRDATLEVDSACSVTLSVSDIDDGSFDPDGSEDVESICITAVDGEPVDCLEEVEFFDDLGLHVLTLTITDKAGASDSCDAEVLVLDVTAPALELPPDVTILWTEDSSPAGTGSATATDNCRVDSVSSSDSVVLGDCRSRTITRTWRAIDGSGNGTAGDQVIHVRGPLDAIRDLMSEVESLGLHPGIENSLLSKLSGALDKIEENKTGPAINKLEAFSNEVAAQSGNKIPEAAADDLLVRVGELIDALGAGGGCS